MNDRLRLRLGVIAVALLFVLNGGITQAIPPRYAEISNALGLGPGALGIALLGQTVGLVAVGSLLAWKLGERFGSRLSFGLPVALFCLSPALVAIARSGPALFATQLYEGATNAPLDLAQNTLAIAISARLRKTLLPRFEVGFSAGAVLGSGAGAFSAGRLGLFGYLVGVTVIALALALAAWRFLPAATGPEEAEPEATARSSGRMWALATLAFLCLLAEYVGQDWASVFYRDELHAPRTEYGYGAFAFNAAFVAALLVGGQLADRFGRERVVRVGAALFALAMVAFVSSRSVADATAALTIAGLGAANLVPLALSAVEGHPRYRLWVARITAAMYCGPGASKLVGVLADATSLRWALATSVPVGIAIAAMSPLVRRPRTASHPD